MQEDTFVDHQHTNFRKRLSSKGNECITKTCITRKDFQMHAHYLKDGLQIRITHNKEDKCNSKKDTITQIRHIHRHSFVHKGYIRYDASKIIQTSAALYEKQEPCVIQNEIELELVKENPSYSHSTKSLDLHADSMICKIIDLACMINNVKNEDLTDLSCTSV